MSQYDYADAYDQVSGTGGGDSRPRHFAGSARADIPAGAQLSFTVNLNMDMDIEQITLPDKVADACDVVAATIGSVSLNAGDAPMPGDAFRHDSRMRIRPAVKATPAVPVRITLINLSGAPVTGARVGVVGAVSRAG